MTETKASEPFEGWAILELMGHRRLAGYITEVEIAGAGMLRLDIPATHGKGPDENIQATQFYSPSALYALTPTTEEMARKVAHLSMPRPVERWELPEPERMEAEPDDLPVRHEPDPEYYDEDLAFEQQDDHDYDEGF